MAELRRAGVAGEAVAGIDEAGRGPWAGPVVAAAVIFETARLPRLITSKVDDSKKLAPALRETLFEAIREHAAIGVGQASVAEIEALNISAATHLAMCRAVEALGRAPARAIVDGNRLPALSCPAEALVGGDGKLLEIAAASIVAKVIRDRLMRDLAEAHPGYGWARNVGYGTAEHRAGIERLGLTAHHRRTWEPVRMFLQSSQNL
ncbi:MAG: ribonuclease HII [Alphaproteobacteria bacterium]